MSNQLHITRYRSNPLNNRLWLYTWIFLSVLVLNTIGVALQFTLPLFSLVNLMLTFAFIITLLKFSGHKQTFLKIQGSTIEYYCTEEEKLIAISAIEITQITTRFSVLQVHTASRVHSLNMGLIRQERTRWEIKEMIRQLAHAEGHLSIAL